MSPSRFSWWLLPASLVIAALFSTTSHSDSPAAVPGVFTEKAILGIKPTKDQMLSGEAAAWKQAFGKCPEANHQLPVRVGEPRLTTTKEKQAPSGALVEVTTLEIDFACGSCGGKTCPFAQYCVDVTTTATCEDAPPAKVAFSCAPAPGYAAADRHLRCTALKVDPTNLEAALPARIKMTTVVSGKDTVADVLARMHASVDTRGKLHDSTGKDIAFYERTGCWGNPPANYQDILRKQDSEIQQLKKTSIVVEISCNPSGHPIP